MYSVTSDDDAKVCDECETDLHRQNSQPGAYTCDDCLDEWEADQA